MSSRVSAGVTPNCASFQTHSAHEDLLDLRRVSIGERTEHPARDNCTRVIDQLLGDKRKVIDKLPSLACTWNVYVCVRHTDKSCTMALSVRVCFNQIERVRLVQSIAWNWWWPACRGSTRYVRTHTRNYWQKSIYANVYLQWRGNDWQIMGQYEVVIVGIASDVAMALRQLECKICNVARLHRWLVRWSSFDEACRSGW